METIEPKIKLISEKIVEYKKRNIPEAGTKSGLIEPLFKAIGWDFSDIDSVIPEFPVELDGENNPVDYALKINNNLMLFVEAKRVNIDIKAAIEDGTKKALKKNVPWLIATNGDTVKVLKIDKSLHELERVAFQVVISRMTQSEQALTKGLRLLTLISPENLKSENLEIFWKETLKKTRISTVIINLLKSSNFEKFIEKEYLKLYPNDKPDKIFLKKFIDSINIQSEESAIGSSHKTVKRDPEIVKRILDRVLNYPNKDDKKKIKQNIIEKKELWIEFMNKKKMSTKEFKDLGGFKDKATGGFSYYLTYNGFATKVDYDEIRKGAIYEINEEVIPHIKALLDIV